jgi:hypothetical protein
MAKNFDICIEGSLPVVLANGLNTNKAIYAVEAPTCDLPAATTIGGSAVVALGTITSASANAFTVGLNGTTNPAFNIDASTASSATGVNIKSAAAAGGVAVSVLSSGADEALTIDAKGAGTIGIGLTSTGAVTIKPATTVTGLATFTNGIVIASAKAITGAGTGANGIVLANLKNASATGLSGTQKDIEISIGGVAYYFTVYPTKA